MKTGLKILGIFGLGLLLASGAYAADDVEWTGAGDGNWGSPDNWSTGLIPGTNKFETAILGAGDVVVSATPIWATSGYSIKILDEASLRLANEMKHVEDIILGPDAGSGGGHIKQYHTTGEIIVANDLRIGDSAGATSDSSYTIYERPLTVGNELYVGLGMFELEGNGPTVSAQNMTLSANATLRFDFSKDGISTIEIANALTIASGAKLSIDLQNYRIGGNEIELVRFGSISGAFDPADITITGLAGGSISYDGDSLNLTVVDDVDSRASVLWFCMTADTGTDSEDLQVCTGNRVRNLSSPALSYTKTSDGDDLIYSVSWAGSDFDGDNVSDAISFDLRVESFSDSTYNYRENEGKNEDELFFSSMTELGTPSELEIAERCWGVEANALLDAGETLRYSVENLQISTGYDVRLDGFVAALMTEVQYATGHQLILGEGGGLEAVANNGSDRFGFLPQHPLLITSAQDSEIAIEYVTVKFTVSDLPDTMDGAVSDFSTLPAGPNYWQHYPAETDFTHYPRFSWDVVALSGGMGDLKTYDQIGKMVASYQILGMSSADLEGYSTREDSNNSLSAMIKAIDPTVKTSTYLNSGILLGGYIANDTYDYDEWAKFDLNNDGSRDYGDVRSYVQHNHAHPGLREWWVNTANNLTTNSNIDVIFIDKASGVNSDVRNDEGEIEPWSDRMMMYHELREGVGENILIRGNSLRNRADGGGRNVMNFFNGSYLESWRNGGGHSFVPETRAEATTGGMQLMREAAVKGKLLTPIIAPEVDDVDDRIAAGEHESVLEDMKVAMQYPLAMHLIFAEEYSYFTPKIGSLKLEDAEFAWNPTPFIDDLHEPLGPPLGPPLKNGFIYSRSFEHVDVWMNVATEKGELIWDWRPIADSQNLWVNEESSVAMTLTASDPQNEPLTYAVYAQPANGVLTGTAPDLVYTPNPDFMGEDRFTFKAYNDTAESLKGTVLITVENVNQDAPYVTTNLVVYSGTNAAVQDIGFSAILPEVATDPDGDHLTYSTISGPSWLIVGPDGTLDGTPSGSDLGINSWVISAIDPAGLSSSFALEIFVYDNSVAIQTIQTNSVASAYDVTGDEAAGFRSTGISKSSDGDGDDVYGTAGTFFFGDGVASKVTGQPFTLNTDSGPSWVTGYAAGADFESVSRDIANTLFDDPTASISSGVADWASTAIIRMDSEVAKTYWEEIMTFTVDASAPRNFRVGIMAGNDYRTDGRYDPTGLRLSCNGYSAAAEVTGLDVELGLVFFDVSLATGVSGTFSIEGQKRLNTQGSSIAGITFDVLDNVPTALAQSVSAVEDTATAITLTGSDADGDPLTYGVVRQPARGVLSGTAPDLIYTPGMNYTGADSFTFIVNDGTANSTVASVSITVTAGENDGPIAQEQWISTAEETAKAVQISAIDPEWSTTLTYTVVRQPAHGVLSGTAPNIIYTPEADFNGVDWFTFTGNDGDVSGDAAAIWIRVTGVNDAPVAQAQSVALDEDIATAITLTATDLEEDPLRYTVLTQPAHGVLSGTAPNLIYTPEEGYIGADQFTFMADDFRLDGAAATVSITVNSVTLNAAPSFSTDPILGADAISDRAYSATLAGSATDVDGDLLSYSKVSGPAWLSVASDGTLSGTPASTDEGVNSWSVQAEDPDGLSATVSLEIEVIALVSATVFDTGFEYVGGAPTVGTDAANLNGADAQIGTWSGTIEEVMSFTAVDGGSLLVDGNDGNISGVPATSNMVFLANLSESIPLDEASIFFDYGTYRTKSADTKNNHIVGYDSNDNEVFHLIVSARNGIERLGYDAGSGEVFDLPGTDEDADGDVPGTSGGPNVTIGLNLSDTGYTISLDNGTKSYTSSEIVFTGGTDLAYVEFTGQGGVDNSSRSGFYLDNVTINAMVVIANQMPIADAKAATVAEDGSIGITLSGSDADGDSLAYAVTTAPANGSLSGTAPALTYTPTANYNGTDSFTYTVNDGTVDSAEVTVSITVDAMNDAPIADAKAASVDEDGTVAIALTGLDVDGDSLTYAVVTAPANGSLSGTAPSLTYTPTANYNGTDSFTYTVNDGTVDSADVTVSITVDAMNDAPIADAKAASVDEDGTVAIALTGLDVDGDSLTYAVVTAPANGSLSGTAPVLTYTPIANYNGTDSFTYTVNDGTVDSAEVTVSITVDAMNDAPIADAKAASVDEDGTVAIALTGSDVDGDSLTSAVVTAPANGSLSGSAPSLTYTPDANYNGADSFTYTVNDGTVDSADVTVSITVDAMNDAPIADAKAASVDEDGTVAIALTGLDVDGDSLTYAVVTAPANGSLSGSAPSLTYTPDANYNGADSFTYTVNDGTVDSADVTVSITVDAMNDAPIADAKAASVDEDGTVAIALTGSDVDGDSLTYAVVTAPANGSLSGSAPSLTYTPDANYNGADSFTYTVNDGTVDSADVTVSITVDAMNDAPIADAKAASVDEDGTVAIALTGLDVDGDSLTYAVVTAPANGSLSGTAPVLTYTPIANYNGTDSFTYTVNDGTVDSAEVTVSITVDAMNDAPIADAKAASVDEDGTVAIALTGSDVDGDSLTSAVVTAPANGSLSGSAPSLTYTPDANYNGADSFTYTVNDGTVDSADVTVSITVDAMNDAPIADAKAASVDEDGTVAIALTGLDVDGDSLTYAVVTAPANGSLSGSAPSLTYTPDANYNGADSFTYTVNDGTVDSADVTVSITVDAMNDAPIADAKAASVDEDGTVAIALTGSDVDGDSLTYAVVTAPANGSLSGTAPSLTYTPTANYNGTDSFTYTVNDGTVDSAEVTVSITVDAVNDVPSANAQSVSVDEDSSVSITLSGSDADGDSLTYAVVSQPANGSLSGTAPNLTYTPDASYSGSDSFTFTVNDGTVNSASATVSITVNAAGVGGWTELTNDDFESGFGNWVDGGDDVALSSVNAIGAQCLDIQDNSGDASSSWLANSLDLTGYSELKVEFTYMPVSMDSATEDFWLLFSADGGTTWSTVKAFVLGVDFENDVRENPTVTIDSGSYNFTSDVKIKFRCDASGDKDDIYIDNVVISAVVSSPEIRVAEYYLTTGDFSGTSATVTLDQDLADDYYILVRGSRVGDGKSYPDNNYARVTAVPDGLGELASSGAADQIQLGRYVADMDWEGVVTVVECVNSASAAGFKLVDIVATSLTGTSGTDTSTAWNDAAQVVLFGGYRGGGASFSADVATRNQGASVHTRLYPSGTGTLNWARNAAGETLVDAMMTTFVVEWGSEWGVQHVNVVGSNGGDGADAVGEYMTAAISSVSRPNSWVWAAGSRVDAGIGDCAEACLVTLGDGVNQNATESSVAVGSEYTDAYDFDVYVLTHPDLAVDYRFKADGDSTGLDIAVTVDSATAGTRFGWVYNGLNGTGDYHPRNQFWSRYTSDSEVTISRGFDGQNFPAWVQGIDLSGLND